MKKIGFIGAGNMAGAIVKGIVSSGINSRVRINAYDINSEKAEDFCKICSGVRFDTAVELAKNSDYIFLAVKPQNIDDVLADIKGAVSENCVLVSIIAGMSSGYIKKSLGFDAKVIPVMPNTPLLLGCGAIAMSKVAPVTDDEYQFVKGIFSAGGVAEDVPEGKLKEIIAINGSSPAFIYLFAKYFLDYAKGEQIDEQTALGLFCKSLEGSAKMMTESGYSIDELIKMVSSPGGTTIAGLQAFYDKNLGETVNDACRRCTGRAYELAK